MVTPKADIFELLFLYFANCIMVIYICIKFHTNISKVFKLQSGHKYITEITIFKLQRAITPKVDLFLCSASCLMMLYICMKFHQNIWNGFQLRADTSTY